MLHVTHIVARTLRLKLENGWFQHYPLYHQASVHSQCLSNV